MARAYRRERSGAASPARAGSPRRRMRLRRPGPKTRAGSRRRAWRRPRSEDAGRARQGPPQVPGHAGRLRPAKAGDEDAAALVPGSGLSEARDQAVEGVSRFWVSLAIDLKGRGRRIDRIRLPRGERLDRTSANVAVGL